MMAHQVRNIGIILHHKNSLGHTGIVEPATHT